MSIEPIFRIDSSSLEDTWRIAAAVGQKLKGNETIELISDLGGGKTAFVHGLVQGAGSTDHVASPTFTISKEYKAPHFTIEHFDFYRLPEAGIEAAEVAEAVQDPTIVTVVEWGGAVNDVLPPERLTITITPTGEDSREFAFTHPDTYAYLLEGLQR